MIEVARAPVVPPRRGSSQLLSEDCGFNKLPPPSLKQEQGKTCQALDVTAHGLSYDVLPPIKGSCLPPARAMKVRLSPR
ncbi:hypothetical protein AOLI_G00183200 [Acnodon oligacanthus]